MYFDEQMNYVDSAIPKRVNASDTAILQIAGNNSRCPQNGFAYVFLSNETQNMMVYFDDFKVTHTRSAIVEENHYLPFGLKIAAISSRKLGNIDNGNLNNNYCYQGIYAEVDEEIGWNEFELRNYDAQIGRWTGVDPDDEFASGYVGMGNNPVCLADPSGGGTESILSTWGTLAGFVGGAIAGVGWVNNTGGNESKGAAFKVIGSAIAGALIGGLIDDILLLSNVPFKQIANATETINVVIRHGNNDKNYNDLGGKGGGHVTINFGDDILYGFTGQTYRNKKNNDGTPKERTPWFSFLVNKKKHVSEVHGSEGNHNSMTTIKQGLDEVLDPKTGIITYRKAYMYTVFEIKVTAEQKTAMHNWYKVNLNKSPFPYTFFGKRCNQTAFWNLKRFGVIDLFPHTGAFHSFFTPVFFKFLWSKGYNHTTYFQPGGLSSEDAKKVNFFGKQF